MIWGEKWFKLEEKISILEEILLEKMEAEYEYRKDEDGDIKRYQK